MQIVFCFIVHEVKKMSENLKNNIDYLHVLCKCNKRQREGIIEGANKELIDTICKCADNVLDGRLQLTDCQYKRLKGYKKELRLLRDKGAPLSEKKNAIVQKGGFLGALLTPIIAIAGSLIGDAVGNLIRK